MPTSSTSSATTQSVPDGASRLTLTSSNVRVAVTGSVYVAPVGTTGPTDAGTALAATWLDLGYLSEDGLTLDPSKTDTTSIVAWQNSHEVRKAVTKVENSLKFTMIETSAATLSLYFGEVIDVGDKEYVFGGAGSGRVSLVFDVIDGTDESRIWVPNCEVTERGSVMFKNGEAIGLEVTVSAYPSSLTDNKPFKRFFTTALA